MPAVQYPRSALRPGKVVWAKVEGHDWWPACIVRRRAVPKEVGPPPGGQVRTLECMCMCSGKILMPAWR
jgi:hypothetical protein